MGKPVFDDIKIVLVGPSSAGKSSLLSTFHSARNATAPSPTSSSNSNPSSASSGSRQRSTTVQTPINECLFVTARVPLEVQPVPTNEWGTTDQPQWAVWRSPLKWMGSGSGEDGVIEVAMQIWDTRSGDEAEHLRALKYDRADVVAICIALDDRESVQQVKEKWLPEIRARADGAPIVLVGTKSDMRRRLNPYDVPSSPTSRNPAKSPRVDRKIRPLIEKEEALELAMDIQAHTYLECSAEENKGVELIFQTLAWYAVRHATEEELKDREGGSGGRKRSRSNAGRSRSKSRIGGKNGECIIC